MENNKKKLVNEIINLEYEMFDKVNGMDGRASCQDNFNTFFVMRYSQFIVLGYETLMSYKEDLLNAKLENKNLITEKYAHMMKYTDPEYYEKFWKDKLVDSQRKNGIIEKIMELMEKENNKFQIKYPNISTLTRPKDKSKVANVDVYLEGELKTYSEKTLENYLTDVIFYCVENKSIVEEIQRETMKFYGFDTLEIAEKEVIKFIK